MRTLAGTPHGWFLLYEFGPGVGLIYDCGASGSSDCPIRVGRIGRIGGVDWIPRDADGFGVPQQVVEDSLEGFGLLHGQSHVHISNFDSDVPYFDVGFLNSHNSVLLVWVSGCHMGRDIHSPKMNSDFSP